MVAKVTVQGTVTPAVGGPRRGERWEVEATDRVRGWVRAGAATVVAGSLRPEPQRPERVLSPRQTEAFERLPESLAELNEDEDDEGGGEVSAPARNASREQWANYLRAKGIRFPDDRAAFDDGDKRAWASRDDLIIIEQQATGGR